jgi:hypothetical protein
VTPTEVAALLVYAASIDPRVRRKDDKDRALQVTAWHTQLERADANDARAAVDAHYSQPRAEPPVPGDIRSRCIALANDRIERGAAKAITGPDLKPMPDEIRDQLRAIRDSWSAPIRMNTPDRDKGAPRRPGRPVETDRDRIRAGRPVTVCFKCVAEIPAPAGWPADNREAPPVYCGPCAAALNRQEAAS